MRQRAVVVGTDGTDGGTAAVEWAAGEAQRRRLPLRIVYAFDWEWPLDAGNEYVDVARTLSDVVEAEARAHARGVAPDLVIETDTFLGHAAPWLLELSLDAEVLVVGGGDGFSGLPMGSVRQQIVTRASCPVAVVRGRAAPAGPVVAGVDDSPAAAQVLAAAFETAADRHGPLTVIRSVRRRPPDRLDEWLTPWRDKFPQIPVTVLRNRHSPDHALVEASRTAQVVVLGRPGSAGRAGLGGTVRHVLRHAGCPVLIAGATVR